MEEQVTEILNNHKGKYADAQWNTEPITVNELTQIIKRFKKAKAPGPDDITTDLIKELNEENREEVLNLINEWWIAGSIPEDMLTARVVSLYKKGNPEILENYRPISLLNTFYKILAAALQRRISGAIGHLVMKNNTVHGGKEHWRCNTHGKKNPRIRRKTRTYRHACTSRLGKGFRQNRQEMDVQSPRKHELAR